MSRPLPVLPPLLKPLPKQRPPATDAAPAALRSNSGRVASGALLQPKLDTGGWGVAAAGAVPVPGSPKAGGLPSKHGPQAHRQGAGAQVDSAGLAGSGSASGVDVVPGVHPQHGVESFPASSGGSGTQPAAERVPVKSVMGTEASKLAARLAKLTGEAGIQLSTTGRVPPPKAPGGGAAAARPLSASSAGTRLAAAAPGRNMRR